MAKSKLTDEMTKDFCSARSLGLNVKASCDYAGISEPTYYTYINRASDDIARGKKNTKYAKFFYSVKKAEASFRVYHMSKIRDAAESGSWQASAWSLERCFPNEYGRVVKMESENGILDQLLRALKEDEKN